MDFAMAALYLDEGEVVRRKTWAKNFAVIRGEDDKIHAIDTSLDLILPREYRFKDEDKNSRDWEIVE